MIETLPSVPGGRSERSSRAYCAAFPCISLAPNISFERWLRCFFLLFCFAASSGPSGAKATRMASTVDICFKKLLFMGLVVPEALMHHARHVIVCRCLGLYPETARPGSRKDSRVTRSCYIAPSVLPSSLTKAFVVKWNDCGFKA